MKPRTAILTVLCLAASWYYAISLSSTGGVGLKLGAPNDYFQLWNTGRAMLHHENPYGLAVAERDQVFTYGGTAKSLGIPNDRRLAYPILGTFPLLALSLLDFRIADRIVFCLFAAGVALSIGWLRGKWDKRTVLYGLLAFASYPVIDALQMRQPTLLFFGLIVGSFALLRSGRLIQAAIFAALAAAKPQIALPLLLPMMVWTLAKWHARKRFAIAFAASLLALTSISLIVVPGWIPEWLSCLRGYSQYVHPSIAVSTFGDKGGLAVSAILVVGLSVVLWINREHDLFFLAAISTAIFSLVIQGEIYNATVLIIPAIWVADNIERIEDAGAISQIALAVVRVAFVEFWLANAVGALLLHTTPLGKSIAWRLSVDMGFPVVGSLAAMMIVQLFFPGKRLAANLGTASRSVART